MEDIKLNVKTLACLKTKETVKTISLSTIKMFHEAQTSVDGIV